MPPKVKLPSIVPPKTLPKPKIKPNLGPPKIPMKPSLFKHISLDEFDILKQVKRTGDLNLLKKIDNLEKLKFLKNGDLLKGIDDLNILKKIDDLNVLKKMDDVDILRKIEDLKLLDKIDVVGMFDKASLFRKIEDLNFAKKLEDFKIAKKLEDLKFAKKMKKIYMGSLAMFGAMFGITAAVKASESFSPYPIDVYYEDNPALEGFVTGATIAWFICFFLRMRTMSYYQIISTIGISILYSTFAFFAITMLFSVYYTTKDYDDSIDRGTARSGKSRSIVNSLIYTDWDIPEQGSDS
jgi:hypothetical protein